MDVQEDNSAVELLLPLLGECCKPTSQLFESMYSISKISQPYICDILYRKR